MLGKTAVELDQTTCQQQECLLGDFMADAMLTYRQNLTADEVDFALINAGGIRATIDVGDITRGEVLTSFPFGNSIVELEFTGKDLWTVLEGIVYNTWLVKVAQIEICFPQNAGQRTVSI